MGNGAETDRGARVLLNAAALVVVIAGMRAAESILVPFLVAAFLSLIAGPPVYWLRRRGVGPTLAVAVVAVVMVGGAMAVGTLIGTSLNDFTKALPTYQSRLQEDMALFLSWLKGLGFQISEAAVLDAVDPGAAMRLAAGMLRGLGGVLTNGFLILVTVIFILLEVSSFPDKLRAVLRDPEASFARFGAFTENVNRYLAIKTWVSLATGVAVAVWLAILGVDFPVLWGLLAFFFNFVPNLGSIIAAVPAVLLALVQFGPGQALLAAAGYVIVNVVMGNGIEPRFMGRGLGLSPLVVFLSLVVWGWVFGPVGMLLSVPLTMTLKIALESYEDTRWIAILLGSSASARAAVASSPGMDDGAEPEGTDLKGA